MGGEMTEVSELMENITFYDVRKAPFTLHGLYHPEDGSIFKRIPEDVASNTNPNVAKELYRVTSGGRVRFATDSDTLVVRVTRLPDQVGLTHDSHPQFGFDLYVKTPLGARFLGSAVPQPIEKGSAVCEHVFKLPEGKKELTLYLPTTGGVADLSLGIAENAAVWEHTPYTYQKPILFYGSSITQGIAASRSGKTYPAMISRRFDLDFINLGFAGSCLGEEAICRHMAEREMGAFVSDYDHNRSCAERLETNHYQVYEIIREKHPDIPYYMISRPDFCYNKKDFDRRAVVMESYLRAWRGGDRNVYFIDGSAFFADTPDIMEYTLDACHPTDEGFQRMANLVGTVFANTLDFDKLK